MKASGRSRCRFGRRTAGAPALVQPSKSAELLVGESRLGSMELGPIPVVSSAYDGSGIMEVFALSLIHI